MTTPTTKEAMQAALKALEALTSAASPHDSNKGRSNEGRWVTMNAPRSLVDAAAVALTLLRSALEEGGEPVAWMAEDRERLVPASTMETAKRAGGASAAAMRSYPIPLYISPLAADTQDKRNAQMEAVRQWFIQKHDCWFTAASLREMFAVAAKKDTP